METESACCARRFVGLLLVTKLLSSPTSEEQPGAIQQVLEALGSNFLDRLLLPLTRSAAQVRNQIAMLTPPAWATCMGMTCMHPATACSPRRRSLIPVDWRWMDN